MAIQLNSNALNVYRNAGFENPNAIINADGESIVQNGTYGGALSALSRSSEEKARNNAARTALLVSLGKAFNIRLEKNENGSVKFTKDFMSNLEKILGSDFKRSDFGINADGKVSSGKPLTMRRIKAIVDKADFVGDGDFNVEIYEKKLAQVKKGLNLEKQSLADIEKLAEWKKELKPLVIVLKALEFLKNEAPKTVIIDQYYEAELEFGTAEGYNGIKYRYYDAENDGYSPLTDLSDYQNYLSRRLGVIMHTEQAGFAPAKDPQSINKLEKYVTGNLKRFVRNIINTYLDAMAAGKVDNFNKFLLDPGTCLEAKCYNLEQYAKENFPVGEMDVESTLEARLAAVDGDNGNAPAAGVDKLIGEIINTLDQEGGDQSDEWAGYADRVKERLVGRNAQIVELADKDGEKAFVPVMEDGKPVVRKLTAEDIDRIGPQYMQLIMGEFM